MARLYVDGKYQFDVANPQRYIMIIIPSEWDESKALKTLIVRKLRQSNSYWVPYKIQPHPEGYLVECLMTFDEKKITQEIKMQELLLGD